MLGQRAGHRSLWNHMSLQSNCNPHSTNQTHLQLHWIDTWLSKCPFGCSIKHQLNIAALSFHMIEWRIVDASSANLELQTWSQLSPTSSHLNRSYPDQETIQRGTRRRNSNAVGFPGILIVESVQLPTINRPSNRLIREFRQIPVISFYWDLTAIYSKHFTINTYIRTHAYITKRNQLIQLWNGSL